MFDKNLLYVLTILEAIEKIFIYTKDYKTADEFYSAEEQKTFNATVNLLIAIGEESKKIDLDIKVKYPAINWKLLAGLRDKISHDYRGIDPEIILSVVKDDLEILRTTLVLMLKEINIDENILNKLLDSKYFKHLKYLI